MATNPNNPLFNSPEDKYVFTGSAFRGDTLSQEKLTLSKGSGTIIDLCQNAIDISALNVYINKNTVLTSSETTNAILGDLTAVGTTILFNLTAGATDISSTLRVRDEATFDDDVTIEGNLTVRGTTTTINSSIVDISDKNITLAAGNTSRSQALGAGFDICGTNATFRYDFTSNTSVERFVSSVGLSVSGNILPNNNISVLPVSYNSFQYITNPSLGNNGTSNTNYNTWQEAPGYTCSITPLSYKSCIKIEFRVNYIASPAAEQYLGFKIRRYSNGNSGLDNSATLFVDQYVGSKMGVTARGVYTGSYIDDLSNGLINPLITSGTITYHLYYKRTREAYSNNIDTSFGIIGGITDLSRELGSLANETSVNSGNYMLLQELYRPL